MNEHIATKLSRLVSRVLSDISPSVPQRGVPLPSVLRSRKRKAKVENLRYITWRHRRGLTVMCSDRVLSPLEMSRMRHGR